MLRLRHALRLPTFGNAPRIEYEGYSSPASLSPSSTAASSRVHPNMHAEIADLNGKGNDSGSGSSSIPFGPADWRAESRILWRIDRDEVGSTYSLVKNNLMALFVGPRGAGDLGPPATVSATTTASSDTLHRKNSAGASAGASASAANSAGAGASAQGSGSGSGSGSGTAGIGDVKRRRLIVDLLAPRFRVLSMPLGAALPAALRSDFAALNSDQRRAVERVLTARDYALVLGTLRVMNTRIPLYALIVTFS